MTCKRAMLWLLACGAAAPVGALLVFAGIGWSQGFAVGSGMVHLLESYPIVATNPAVEEIAWHRVSWVGDIENRDLSESSGLASSNLVDDVLWSMNDSGNSAEIFALSTQGKHLGSWHIAMPDPFDWEAMDSFVLDGVAYLLIGDVGDNFRWRPELSFVVVREPDLPDDPTALQESLPVEWSVTYSYPDGFRDCEAIAVDEATQEVLLLSKRRYPAELFSVPLHAANHVQAEKLAELVDLPRPTQFDIDEDPAGGKYRYMPSGMDLSGNRLLVTTYKHAYLYRRDDLRQPPFRISMPSVGQRESIAFARQRDDIAYVSKERADAVGVADLFMIELPASVQTPGAVTRVD